MPPPEGTRWPGRGYTRTFRQVLSDAIAELSVFGYVSAEQIERWIEEIRRTAEAELGPDWRINADVRSGMDAIFAKLVDRGRIADYVPGVTRFDLSMVRPELRAELDRRIIAAADLIKLHRREAVEGTLQRFRGWSTSIPIGGDGAIDKRETRTHIGKSVTQFRFEKRRVDIDQGHKLVANIGEIVAVDQGAIAGIWHSHGEHDKSYDARKKHLERAGHLFLVRDSWAIEKGLVKRGSRPYMDEIERPGQLPFCFPGDLRVPFADGVEVAYRRWYRGQLTKIVTESGKTLRATPNHPILTAKGWVAIGALQEGDEVIEVPDYVIGTINAKADHHDAVPTIAEIFGSLAEMGIPSRISGAAKQFHGDGAEGQVDVVYAARPLRFDFVPPAAQSCRQLVFAKSALSCASGRALQLLSQAGAFLTALLMSGANAILMLLWRLVEGDQFVGGLVPPRGAPCLANAADYDCSGYAQPLGELKDALASFVRSSYSHSINGDTWRPSGLVRAKIDQAASMMTPNRTDGEIECIGDLLKRLPFRAQATHVLRVDRHDFSGHVYNLQTADGWYIGNGIVSHNCRCFYQWVTSPRRLPDDVLTRAGQEWVRAGRDRMENLAA